MSLFVIDRTDGAPAGSIERPGCQRQEVSDDQPDQGHRSRRCRPARGQQEELGDDAPHNKTSRLEREEDVAFTQELKNEKVIL